MTENPEVKNLRQEMNELKRELLESRQAEQKRADLYEISRVARTDSKKYAIVLSESKEDMALEALKTFKTQYGCLPNETLDESIKTALDVIENQLRNEWKTKLTGKEDLLSEIFPGRVSFASEVNERASGGTAAREPGRANPKTLTNAQAGSSPPRTDEDIHLSDDELRAQVARDIARLKRG